MVDWKLSNKLLVRFNKDSDMSDSSYFPFVFRNLKNEIFVELFNVISNEVQENLTRVNKVDRFKKNKIQMCALVTFVEFQRKNTTKKLLK